MSRLCDIRHKKIADEPHTARDDDNPNFGKLQPQPRLTFCDPARGSFPGHVLGKFTDLRSGYTRKFPKGSFSRVSGTCAYESLILAFCLATRRCMNLRPSFL